MLENGLTATITIPKITAPGSRARADTTPRSSTHGTNTATTTSSTRARTSPHRFGGGTPSAMVCERRNATSESAIASTTAIHLHTAAGLLFGFESAHTAAKARARARERLVAE